MRRPLHALSIGVLAFVVSAVTAPWEFPRGSDGSAMLATAESLLDRGTLAIDARFTQDDGYSPSARTGPDGLAYSKYGVGLPVVELPLLGLAQVISRLSGFPRSRVQPVILSLMNPLLTGLAVVLIGAVCLRLGTSPAGATLAALGYGLATPALVYASDDGTEALQSCLIALAAWSLAVFEDGRNRRALWIAGAALAAGVLTKTTVAVLAPAFLVGAWCAARSHGAGKTAAVAAAIEFAAPLSLGIAVVAGLNWARFGSVTVTGYNTPLLTHPLAAGLYGLLLGPNKGLVFYAPLVLLAPVGLAALARRATGLAVAITLGTIAWTVLNAKFYEWGGGWAWGPRYLVPVLPLVFMAVGMAADRARLGVIARTLFACGLLVNLLGVAVDEGAYRRATMKVWLADRTGYVLAGSPDGEGLISVPRSPEDVLPAFSSVAGHWWLARLALARCDCSDVSDRCACRTGELRAHQLFLSPPWVAQYPDAIPSPPYGTSIVRPKLLRWLYRATLFDPDLQQRP